VALKTRRTDALLLEDFDIKRDAKEMPDKMIGVRTNYIYMQIARIRESPKRRDDLLILITTLENSCDGKEFEPTYIPMTVKDIAKCFEPKLKKFPKSTFIEI
jgi:hypothetical protein